MFLVSQNWTGEGHNTCRIKECSASLVCIIQVRLFKNDHTVAFVLGLPSDGFVCPIVNIFIACYICYMLYVVCWSICPWWLSLVKGRRRRPMSAVKESRHFHLRCRCSEPAHLYWHYRHLVSVCFAHRISNCLLINFTSKATVTQSCQYVCHSAYHSDCLSAQLLQKSGWPLSWKTWKSQGIG